MAKLKDLSSGDTSAEGHDDSNTADAEEDAMILANDELANFAEELNSFYGHPKNRKLINSSQVFVFHLLQPFSFNLHILIWFLFSS